MCTWKISCGFIMKYKNEMCENFQYMFVSFIDYYS